MFAIGYTENVMYTSVKLLHGQIIMFADNHLVI